MAERESLPAEYFEQLYAESDDPWGFATRRYEADKYQATLDALPRQRYRAAFEIVCSFGVLSERGAWRCDRLLAVDVAEAALARARERCRHLPHVQFRRMSVPDQFPDERFDLILISEVGYYWGWNDLAKAGALIVAHLEPGGHLLLVHWLPEVADYPLTGDEVHEAFMVRDHGLRRLIGRRQQLYRIDLFERGI